MSKIGHLERETQNRIVKLFRDTLGYRFLGNWEKEMRYSNIEETLLVDFLRSKNKYSEDLIAKAMSQLRKVAGDQSKSLYDVNKKVYSLLRYGVNMSPGIGQNKVNVELFDWQNPQHNDFAIAEEVSVHGTYKKRPDIVIYINGIAVGILELKRSTVSISEGIRQNLDNQKKEFIQPFFSTIQFIMAGSDHEGLAYGTIDTTEKYYLRWKDVSEKANPNDKYLLGITAPIRKLADSFDHRIDKNIIQLLNKERFMELLHDFIVFDRGVKKLCRPNQYFGVKASQDHAKRREGGIIWHTQGSGKSLTMVWLTKWIRENINNARVLIITDRSELDEQIEKVYRGVNENIYRTKSGSDLIQQLDSNSPWLICSLVHKFGGREELNDQEVDNYLQELKRGLPSDFRAKGEFFVFVDECHRTQSGKLHEGMKTLLPNAVFIGFTGTPLLKKDKQTSLEVFGEYIHTYKFDEAVNDNVVLDLQYEARDIEQKITSMDKIDQWFDAKTRGLTDMARAELKQKWGTIKKVFSSRSRLDKIVADVMLDMGTKERLENGQGNAMLVSESVYNACRYYQLFQDAGLKKCAIVTSYSPSQDDVKGETTGEGNTEKLLKYEVYRKMLNGKDPETFETEVKKKFVEEPGQMKLLIVVDKLLTGFDAPPATYLYIDKSMRDHGLFQAICRVNRLDGEDKDYGYIVDYKDLFKTLNKSIKDYTSGAFDAYAKEDVEGLLKDRLGKSRERLEDALEAARALTEPVEPPKGQFQFQRYFVGDPENKDDLKDTEPRRVALYKAVTKLNRAFANIADEMMDAGYSEKEIYEIREEVKFFENVRKEIQLFSGDYIDLKQYEPAMRHLIDSYIGAEESKILASFEELGLVDLLVAKGVDGIDEMPEKLKKNPESMSEAIESNLRKVIIEERPTNPAYFDKMSVLLDEIIKLRKQKAQEYKEYLQKIVELTRKVKRSNQESASPYPPSVNTEGRQALYDNLEKDEKLAIAVDQKVRYSKKDNWRDHKIKQKQVLNAIKEALKENGHSDQEKAQAIFDLIKNRTDY